NNPIRYTDPTGMYEEDFDDWWHLTNDGVLTHIRSTDDDFHTIFSESGESINVSKSVIDNAKHCVQGGSFSSRNNYLHTSYEVKGESGKDLDSFFYRNTTVEFGYQLYEINGEKVGI